MNQSRCNFEKVKNPHFFLTCIIYQCSLITDVPNPFKGWRPDHKLFCILWPGSDFVAESSPSSTRMTYSTTTSSLFVPPSTISAYPRCSSPKTWWNSRSPIVFPSSHTSLSSTRRSSSVRVSSNVIPHTSFASESAHMRSFRNAHAGGDEHTSSSRPHHYVTIFESMSICTPPINRFCAS